MFKLVNEGQYQGYTYQIVTQKASPKPGYGFIATIAIGGVIQETPLETKANAYEAHQEGMSYFRQLVDTYPVLRVANQK